MIDIEKYFKKGELIPAIVQEEGTNEVLMLGNPSSTEWQPNEP